MKPNKADMVKWGGRMVHKSIPERLQKEQEFTHLVEKKTGKSYARLIFTNEQGFKDKLCPDCATKVGWVHDDGCDMERCPKCGGQLLSCNCKFPLKAGTKDGTEA